MTKEFLMSLINGNGHLDLFFIFIILFVSIGMAFRLGLQLLKTKPNITLFLASVAILTLYQIIGKLVLPLPIQPVLLILLMGGLLILNCKGKPGFSFLWTILIVFSNFLSDVIIGLVCMQNKLIYQFLTTNTLGVMIGILTESSMPIIALIIFSKHSKQNILSMIKDKDVWYYIAFFGAVTYQIYRSTFDFFVNGLKLNDYIEMVIPSIMALCAFLIIYKNLNEKHRAELEKIKTNHESAVEAIEDRFNELKRYEILNKPTIERLVEKELTGALHRHSQSFSLASYVLDEIKRNK